MKHPLIHTNESYNENLQRLILFYNRQAVYYLQKESNVHENIHQTRLCFKRIRSFLRLGRSGTGKEIYQSYNILYRDLSRSLSALRDLTALSETLTMFIKTRRIRASRSFLTTYRNQLLKERKEQLEHIIAGKITKDVIIRLKQKEEEISKWDFVADADEVFTSGAQRIYRKGKRLFNIAQYNPDDHNMHEWRKHVKYFWYHLLVLTPLWPGIMNAWAKEVQTLSQMLGKHHDLVLLENAIGTLNVKPTQKNIINSLRQSIRVRKRNYEQKCMALGYRIYFENQLCVKERLKACWK